MKKLTILLAALGMILVGCTKDNNWTPGPAAPKNAQPLFFPITEDLDIEMDPNNPYSEWEIAVSRYDSTDTYPAATVGIRVLKNTDNVFDVPATITFEAGEADAIIVVGLGEMTIGDTYHLSIAFADADFNPYLDIDQIGGGIAIGAGCAYAMSICPIGWSEVKTGVIQDGLLSEYSGIASDAWYVQYQMADMPDGSTRVRLINPYNCAATDVDADGIYDGCTLLGPGDVDDTQNINMFMTIQPDGSVAFEDYDTYLDAGYGPIYVVWYDQEMYGTYTEDNSIIFPLEDEILVAGDDEGLYCAVGIYFYLSKEAFIESNPHAKYKDYLGQWQAGANTWTVSEGEESDYIITGIAGFENGIAASYTGAHTLSFEAITIDDTQDADYQYSLFFIKQDGLQDQVGTLDLYYDLEEGTLSIDPEAENVGIVTYRESKADPENDYQVLCNIPLSEVVFEKVAENAAPKRKARQPMKLHHK